MLITGPIPTWVLETKVYVYVVLIVVGESICFSSVHGEIFSLILKMIKSPCLVPMKRNGCEKCKCEVSCLKCIDLFVLLQEKKKKDNFLFAMKLMTR